MTFDDPGQLPRAAARRELLARRIEAIDEIDTADLDAEFDTIDQNLNQL